MLDYNKDKWTIVEEYTESDSHTKPGQRFERLELGDLIVGTVVSSATDASYVTADTWYLLRKRS